MNTHLPSCAASATSVDVGWVAVTCWSFLYLFASVGNKSFTACGNSFPAVALTNSYDTLCSLALNSHLPTNLTSSVPTVTGLAGSYPLNSHLPSCAASSTSACAGWTAFTCAPFTYLAASVGNKSFTACGKSFPAVPLVNSYDTLCSLALNSHLPTNLTSLSATVTGPAGSYPLNTHLPSCAASATSVCAGWVAVTCWSFLYLVLSVGNRSFTACGNSFPAVALSNSYVAL